MTDEELQQIKDRVDKATPGEWRAVNEDGAFYVQNGEAPDTTIVVTQSFAPPWERC